MTRPRSNSDVVIVGGGVIGLMSAIELSRADCHVTVIDAGRTGASSPAAGGILMPLYPWQYGEPVNALSKLSRSLYPLWIDAIESLGLETGYRVCGLIALVQEDDSQRRWIRESGEASERLAPGKLAKLEPAIKSNDPALRLPNVAQIDNPLIMNGLLALARREGVTLVADAAVESIRVREGRVTGVTAGDAAWRAGNVVIAAGSWSAELLRPLGFGSDIYPVRGEIQVYQVEPGRLGHIIRTDSEYLVPRADGRILVGSTTDRAGFNPVTTEPGQHRLRMAALSMMPELAAQSPVQSWAGLRPGLDRSAPLIGPVEGVAGLFVNTGHYRNGFALGPGSARLLADQLLGRDLSLDTDPYCVASKIGAGVYS